MDTHPEPAIRHLTYDQLVAATADHECPGIGKDHVCVKIAAVADLPTKFGTFHIVGFWNDRDGKDHVAIVKGDPFGKEDVPVRLHSECLTGDALGSLRCDCGSQLDAALERIGEEGSGVVIYLRGHEGRGIGLVNKIRAYALQDQGLDTVDANVNLGLPVDSRDYGVGAQILRDLGVQRMRVLGAPRRIHGISGFGLDVVDYVA